MAIEGNVQLRGDVQIRVLRNQRPPTTELSLWQIFLFGFPNWQQTREVNLWRLRNLPNLWRGLWKVMVARAFKLSNVYGSVFITILKGDGRRIFLGLASLRVVTTAGVTYIAADMAGGASDINAFKYHGIGTGTNAEAIGDTALQTELTTQYNPDSTRATGNQSSSGGVYTTVGTVAPDSGGTLAITEHGIFSAASAGTLLDRSVFSAYNVVAGTDSIQITYNLTFSSGG